MEDDAMVLMPPPAVPALLGSGSDSSDSGNGDGVYGGRVRRRRRRRASSSGYGSDDGRGAAVSRQPRLPRGDDGARWPYPADVDNGTRWPPSGGHDDHRRVPAAKRSHVDDDDGEQPPAAKRARAADDDGEQPPAAKRARAADDDGEQPPAADDRKQPPAMRFLFAADELPRLQDALEAVASGWTGPAGGVCASVLPAHQGGDLVLTVRAVNEDALVDVIHAVWRRRYDAAAPSAGRAATPWTADVLVDADAVQSGALLADPAWHVVDPDEGLRDPSGREVRVVHVRGDESAAMLRVARLTAVCAGRHDPAEPAARWQLLCTSDQQYSTEESCSSDEC